MALIRGTENANKTRVRFGWCVNGGFLEGVGRWETASHRTLVRHARKVFSSIRRLSKAFHYGINLASLFRLTPLFLIPLSSVLTPVLRDMLGVSSLGPVSFCSCIVHRTKEFQIFALTHPRDFE